MIGGAGGNLANVIFFSCGATFIKKIQNFAECVTSFGTDCSISLFRLVSSSSRTGFTCFSFVLERQVLEEGHRQG